MKRRHFFKLMILVFMVVCLLSDKFISYNNIQKVQSNQQEYFFINGEPVETVHIGMHKNKLLVKYTLLTYKGEVIIDYATGDLRRKQIPLAISKKNGEVVRMNVAFSSGDICFLMCMLLLYIGEVIYFRHQKQKMLIRKSMEKMMNKGSESIEVGNEKVIIVAKKNECTKKLKAVIIKIKRIEDVDYDWIKIWCKEINLPGNSKIYKSKTVREKVKWHVGDLITVLVDPKKESNYEVVTEIRSGE